MRRKMKYERVDITNYLFFPSTLWTVSRSTFNLAFQFRSMGSTLSITFLSGKIHLHTTKDDSCKPVNINAIFLNKICWLLVCNIFCSQFNINNTTILRTNVKLHHASPVPYLNSTKYLENISSHFIYLKGFDIKELPYGFKQISQPLLQSLPHKHAHIQTIGQDRAHHFFLDKLSGVISKL